MDEAQEKALEEKTHKRIHHLQTHGHDVTQLKATYDGRYSYAGVLDSTLFLFVLCGGRLTNIGG